MQVLVSLADTAEIKRIYGLDILEVLRLKSIYFQHLTDRLQTSHEVPSQTLLRFIPQAVPSRISYTRQHYLLPSLPHSPSPCLHLRLQSSLSPAAAERTEPAASALPKQPAPAARNQPVTATARRLRPRTNLTGQPAHAVRQTSQRYSPHSGINKVY